MGFLDFVESFARLMEDRPAWQKMVLYLVLAAPPVCICTELSTFLGCSALAACGAIYGFRLLEPRHQQQRWRQQFGERSSRMRRISWKTRRIGRNIHENILNIGWSKHEKSGHYETSRKTKRIGKSISEKI